MCVFFLSLSLCACCSGGAVTHQVVCATMSQRSGLNLLVWTHNASFLELMTTFLLFILEISRPNYTETWSLQIRKRLNKNSDKGNIQPYPECGEAEMDKLYIISHFVCIISSLYSYTVLQPASFCTSTDPIKLTSLHFPLCFTKQPSPSVEELLGPRNVTVTEWTNLV